LDIIDFIGIKIGDVNGSSDPSNFKADELSEIRGKDALTITTENISMTTGETYVVDLFIHDDRDIVAFQGGVTLDPNRLEILNVDGSAMEMDETHFSPVHLQEEGHLSFAWTDPFNGGLSDETKITVLVKSKGNYKLEDCIKISGAHTPLVAYYADGLDVKEELIELAVEEREEVVFAAYQNTPNPFISTTSILVEMPADGTVDLDIFDALGKKISTQTIDMVYGENYIELSDDMFITGGVFIYEITYEDYPKQVFKMIVAK